MRNNVNFGKVSFGKVGRLELVAVGSVTVNCEGHFRLYNEALSNFFFLSTDTIGFCAIVGNNLIQPLNKSLFLLVMSYIYFQRYRFHNSIIFYFVVKGLVIELTPPHVQSARESKEERVRAVRLASCCDYFSKNLLFCSYM